MKTKGCDRRKGRVEEEEVEEGRVGLRDGRGWAVWYLTRPAEMKGSSCIPPLVPIGPSQTVQTRADWRVLITSGASGEVSGMWNGNHRWRDQQRHRLGMPHAIAHSILPVD